MFAIPSKKSYLWSQKDKSTFKTYMYAIDD